MEILPTLIGGVLSLAGGFSALFLRSKIDKKAEIDYIKVSISDEFEQIIGVIRNMVETHKRTKIISNEYMNELRMNTENYTYLK